MGLVPMLPFLFNKKMNKASKLISESMLGLEFASIEIGGRWYKIKLLSIETICRYVRYWSRINIQESHTVFSIISEVPRNKEALLRGIAEAITGGGFMKNLRSKLIYKRLKKANLIEIEKAVESIIAMTGGERFFKSASLAKNATMIVARPKQ